MSIEKRDSLTFSPLHMIPLSDIVLVSSPSMSENRKKQAVIVFNKKNFTVIYLLKFRPAFISARQNVRATSVGHERKQVSLTNSLDSTVTERTLRLARSVSLLTK